MGNVIEKPNDLVGSVDDRIQALWDTQSALYRALVLQMNLAGKLADFETRIAALEAASS